MKIFLFFYFLIILNFISPKKPKEDNQKFMRIIEWGRNHSVNFSKNLKFTKDFKFKAEKFISIDDIILDIPLEAMMNLNSTFKLLNSTKLQKAYKLYKEEDQKIKLINKTITDEFHVDQSFLAYILYLVKTYPKKYHKTEFYQYFEPIFYMFEDNLDNLPFYYSTEQMRLFINTTFAEIFESLNRYFNDEASTFEKVILKKPINFDDYLKYRIFMVKKYYNISGEINIVPFIDLIKEDYKEPNCVYYIEDERIKVRAILNILPDEEVTLKPNMISNQHRLIFHGDTYDEIIDKFPSYNLPTVTLGFLLEQNISIDDDEILKNKIRDFNSIDLVVPEFYKYVDDIYQEIVKRKKKKNIVPELDGLRLFLKYLRKIRKNMNYVDDELIRDKFYNRNDMNNAKRIIQGEKIFLSKKIEELKDYLKKFRKFKKIYDEKNGQIDIEDL